MKNKLIFNRILLIICLVLFISILNFIILGNISRKGYLSELQFNETLSSNENYSYNFRIKYYSKIFRNSDIYGVYIDTNKIMIENNFIKEMKIEENGSPFGILISNKELKYNEKIDNIDYKLKIKLTIVIILIVFYLFTFLFINKDKIKLLIEYLNKAKLFYINHKKHIFILYSIIILIFILFTIVNSNIKYTSKLTNLELIAESKLGYVYKAKIENYKDNKLFIIDNNSIQLNNTNDIKYYGYSLEITNKPISSFYSTNIYYTENNTFIISNESTNINIYKYNIQIPTFIGDKYKITILAKQLSDIDNILWSLNGANYFRAITKKEVSNDYIILTDIRNANKSVDPLDLNFVIPQGVTEIESILIESLNSNLNIDNNYTLFTFENKYNNDSTLEISYYVESSFLLKVIISVLIIVCLLIILNGLKLNNIFYYIIFIIGILLFIFNFWLVFPGFYNYPDGYYIMSEGIDNKYLNWQPFIIGLTLHFLYKIFGYHEFYILFINMFLWYIGLSIIVFSLYYKFKNKYLILLFLISFIANIFFANITHLKDATSTLFFFFAISILIFKEIVKVNNKILNIIMTLLMYISLLFALLWRHNFIVTIYPVFIYLTYKYLKDINTTKYFFIKFCSIMLIIALILVFVIKFSPRLISNDSHAEKAYVASSTIFLQIAGCAVPANDGSLIPDEWYLENKTFEDLKKQYYKNKVVADYLIMYDNKIFTSSSKYKKDFHKVLVSYIMKYPKNYLKHILNYSYNIILHPIGINLLLMDPNLIQDTDNKNLFNSYYGVFGDNVGIKFNKDRYDIYSFLFSKKVFIKVVYFVIISVILFIITGLLWIFKPNIRNNYLLLSFSLAFSSVATIFIVCVFSPLVEYRYIYPSIIPSIFSLLSFIVFIYDIGILNNLIIKFKKNINKFKWRY